MILKRPKVYGLKYSIRSSRTLSFILIMILLSLGASLNSFYIEANKIPFNYDRVLDEYSDSPVLIEENNKLTVFGKHYLNNSFYYESFFFEFINGKIIGQSYIIFDDSNFVYVNDEYSVVYTTYQEIILFRKTPVALSVVFRTTKGNTLDISCDDINFHRIDSYDTYDYYIGSAYGLLDFDNLYVTINDEVFTIDKRALIN